MKDWLTKDDAVQVNQFDLTNIALSPFPPKYAAGFLNSKEVQDALGVPLNFTGLSEGANKGTFRQ